MPSYHLTELVDSLSKEEIRNFKLYATRINNTSSGENKSVLLFDSIKEGMDEFGDEIVEKLYAQCNKTTKNAFYRLKNRLITDVEQSLLLLNRNKDPRFKVFNIIQLANVFRYKSDYEQAFSYLIKAEKLAIKFKYSDLLDTIYTEILSLATDYYNINPQDYIKKKRGNHQKLGGIQEVDFLISTINYKLRSANYTGQDKELSKELGKALQSLNIEGNADLYEDMGISVSKDPTLRKELNETLESLDINREILKDPKVQFKIHKCYSYYLLQQRNFATLEGYLIRELNRFEEMGFFDDDRYEDQFQMLLWIINCSHINFRIEQADLFIQKFHKALNGQSKKFYDKYLWMYHECRLLNYSFKNDYNGLINLLIEIRDNPELTGNTLYDTFVYINLAANYYKTGELKKALDSMIPITMSDHIKKLSKSIQISIAIQDIILHYENKDFNYVIYRINEVKRVFRTQMKEENFGREKELLGIIKELCSKADPFREPKTIKRIEAFIEKSPRLVPGTGEPLNYKVWLESKLNKQDYFTAIVDEQKRQTEEAKARQGAN